MTALRPEREGATDGGGQRDDAWPAAAPEGPPEPYGDARAFTAAVEGLADPLTDPLPGQPAASWRQSGDPALTAPAEGGERTARDDPVAGRSGPRHGRRPGPDGEVGASAGPPALGTDPPGRQPGHRPRRHARPEPAEDSASRVPDGPPAPPGLGPAGGPDAHGEGSAAPPTPNSEPPDGRRPEWVGPAVGDRPHQDDATMALRPVPPLDDATVTLTAVRPPTVPGAADGELPGGAEAAPADDDQSATTGGRAARRRAAQQTARRRGRRGAAAPTESAADGEEPSAGPRSRVGARRAARARKDSPGVVLSRVVGELFITLGVVMLLFVTYQLWYSNILARQQAGGEAKHLQEKWSHGEGSRDAGAFSAGEGFAILYIPKLDVKVPVAQGINKHKVLDRGMVGHYSEGALKTAMPWDDKGNFAVAGHRNTHGEPFRHINRLTAGDKIVVETSDTFYTYEMASILPQTSPSNVGVIRPVPSGSGFSEPGRYITLTTCTPEFTSTYRMIVWGKMVETRPRSEGKPDALVE